MASRALTPLFGKFCPKRRVHLPRAVFPAVVALLAACGDDDGSSMDTDVNTTVAPASTDTDPATTTVAQTTGSVAGSSSSGDGDARSGPDYGGEFHIETAQGAAGTAELTLVTTNPDGELLCLYENVGLDYALRLEVDVPARQIVTIDHPTNGENSLNVRRANNGECPAPNNNGELVWTSGGLIVALPNRIDVYDSPSADSAIDLQGRGHGAIVNLSSTDGAFCILEPDAEEGSYAYLVFDAGDVHSLNDGFLDLIPGTDTFIVPGGDSNCLTHTKWLEAETNDFYFSQQNGRTSYFVAFDGV